GQVAQRRGGAVRVEVADLLRVHAGVLERRGHAAGRALAVLAGGGHVEGVGAGAEAGQLAVDAGAALLRVLVFLQHQDAGAVAEHETVAVLVPGTGGAGRLVVAGRHRLHRAEAADRGRGAAVLGAAGDHHVGIAVLDHAHGHADRMVGGGAGRDRREVRALDALQDAQLARQHIDDGAGHVEGRDLARTALVQGDGGLLDAAHAADAGADQGADALGVLLGHLQAGVLHGLEAGSQAIVDEGVHLLDVLRRQEGLRVEIAHFAGDAGGIGRGIGVGDRADAAAAGLDAVPGSGQGVADGRDDAHTGDDDATMAHVGTPRLFRRAARAARAPAYRAGAANAQGRASAAPAL